MKKKKQREGGGGGRKREGRVVSELVPVRNIARGQRATRSNEKKVKGKVDEEGWQQGEEDMGKHLISRDLRNAGNDACVRGDGTLQARVVRAQG